MSEIGNAVLWIVNLFLIAMLLFSIAFILYQTGKKLKANLTGGGSGGGQSPPPQNKREPHVRFPMVVRKIKSSP